MDGSSNEGGFGADLILVSPEGHRLHCALKFDFKASNNEAEYEALIAGLKLAKEMRVESLNVYSNSQLVVCQVINEYQAHGEKMVAYLRKAKDLLSVLSSFKIQQVPRERNTQADALARLASTKNFELLEVIPVEFLNTPNIMPTELQSTINNITSADTWMTLIIQYLKNTHVLEDKKQGKLLRLKAAKYILYDGQL